MFSANSSQVAADDTLYVEDVFSTYLYSGNNTGQTITNGIDLSGKGGMVLLQCRSNDTGTAWNVYDTQRGARNYLRSSSTSSQSTTGSGAGLTSFNSNGFTLGTSWNTENFSPYTYVSWTFRKAPKFFDVLTVTGQATQTTFNHSLGVTPGLVIIKTKDATGDWFVYHRSVGSDQYLLLNSGLAPSSYAGWCTANSTSVTVKSGVMGNGNSHVVYLFAHDTTADGIVQCGQFTSDGSGAFSVTLGWEPQWLMIKRTDGVESWRVYDNMRGMTSSTVAARELLPNSSVAEDNGYSLIPEATGFSSTGFNASRTYMYVAIRRGPMRIPTSGTSVFAPVAWTGSGGVPKFTYSGFAVDAVIYRDKRNSPYTGYTYVSDKIRGYKKIIWANTADPETEMPVSDSADFTSNTGVTLGDSYGNSTYTNVDWMFRRAPSFFDVVCYTGDNVGGRTLTHSLKAIPELILVKRRSASSNWIVYSASIAANRFLQFDLSDPSYFTGNSYWNNTRPTSTVFTLGNDSWVNGGGSTFVAYLFASCPGVSKVGSYTGTGTTQTINCGFAAGARFVMIKRTDADGNWYVWDTARGIVSGNDPYLATNSTASEVTNTDYIDTNSSGFEISSTAPAAINANGGTFIYLAVA